MSFGELVFVAGLASLGLCVGLGAALRRWLTFTPIASGRLLVADLRAGASVCVRGRLVREIDRSATGAGYRNPSLAWVVRPDASGAIALMAHSELVRHASRARYHAAWLATLARL